jgi:hypothetical protein
MANRRFIDFPIASSVGDNDIVLIWQDGLNKQTTKGTLIQGAPTSLEGLTDVDIAGLINGQILQYNSVTGKWENVDRTDINLSQLGDVSIVSPSNGQVLVYNSTTSKWENSSAGFVPYVGAVTTVDLGAQTIQAGSFVKAGGTPAQFLKANGSVDSNTYLTTGSAAATYVPYTGATADVNLGTHDLTAERGTFENNGSSDTLTVNHTSGSGYGIIVTKGGNNEALYVSKTSGSGNAMTVVGGRTSLVDLALSSVTNTAGDFLTISGGVVHKRTAAEVRTDIGAGTVTSVGLSSATSGVTIGSTPITTSGTITLAIATASGSQNGLLSNTDWTTFNNKQNALTNPVTGTGASGRIAFFTGSTSIGGEDALFWDSTNNRLGIGTTIPTNPLHIVSNEISQLNIQALSGNTNAQINLEPTGTGIALIGPANAVALAFRTDATQRLAIFSNGNVTIANSPTDAGFKLDVNGTGRFVNGVNMATTSGSVGIGTGSPASKLDINIGILSTAGAFSNAALNLYNPTNIGAYSQITFGYTIGATYASSYLGFVSTNQGSFGFGDLVFGTRSVNTDTQATERLRIASTGAATFSSSVSVGGSFATPHTTKSANYTLDATDYTVGFDCASNRTANLPDATTCAGRIYVIYQYNTNIGLRYVTIDGNGSQTINGLTTVNLQYQDDFSSVMIQSNGSNWVVIASALYAAPV